MHDHVNIHIAISRQLALQSKHSEWEQCYKEREDD